MEAHADDASVCENGAFALGNLCRALGKVGNSATGDFAAPELASIDEQLRQRTEGQQRKGAAAEAGALEAIVRAMLAHESVQGIQEWGSRALSIITYESTPLRERAKQAGAKMTWLMGLSESMESAQKARAVLPVSKTGRPTVRPALGERENAPPTRAPQNRPMICVECRSSTSAADSRAFESPRPTKQATAQSSAATPAAYPPALPTLRELPAPCVASRGTAFPCACTVPLPRSGFGARAVSHPRCRSTGCLSPHTAHTDATALDRDRVSARCLGTLSRGR